MLNICLKSCSYVYHYFTQLQIMQRSTQTRDNEEINILFMLCIFFNKDLTRTFRNSEDECEKCKINV